MDVVVRRAEPDDYLAFARIYEEESAYSGTLQTPYPSRAYALRGGRYVDTVFMARLKAKPAP